MKSLRFCILGAILAASWLVTWRIHRSAAIELQAKREAEQQTVAGVDQLRAENEQLSNTLTQLKSTPSLSEAEVRELLRLRNEVGRLQDALSETHSLQREILRLRAGLQDVESNFIPIVLTATLADEMELRRKRIAQLQRWLTENPSERIPELQFLSELDWLRAVENPVVNTEEECRQTMSHLRRHSEQAFSKLAFKALQQYAQANDNRFPTTLSELKPYFVPPVDDAVLERYEIVAAASLASSAPPRVSGDRVITQKAPVNADLDYRSIIGINGPRPVLDNMRWSSAE